jgi:hypothetical protein
LREKHEINTDSISILTYEGVPKQKTPNIGAMMEDLEDGIRITVRLGRCSETKSTRRGMNPGFLRRLY